MEQVINILNQKYIVATWSSPCKEKDPIDSLSKILMKYLHDGIKIDYVLSGHIHMAYVSDLFSRCSSLWAQIVMQTMHFILMEEQARTL